MNEHAPDDRVDRALQSLHAVDWQRPLHRRELAARLVMAAQRRGGSTAGRARRRRRWLLPFVVLGVGILLAAGGLERVVRLFSITILKVERDANGNIKNMLVSTSEGQTVELEPVDAPPLAREAPASAAPDEPITVPVADGGTLVLRVVARGRRWHDSVYVAEPSDASPRPGQRLLVKELRVTSLSAAWRGQDLEIVQHFGDGEPLVLTLTPLAGEPHRYGDGSTIVEVLSPR